MNNIIYMFLNIFVKCFLNNYIYTIELKIVNIFLERVTLISGFRVCTNINFGICTFSAI